MKCIKCGKPNATNPLADGGMVCDECKWDYFICAKCGRVFEKDDSRATETRGDLCQECDQNPDIDD